MVCLVWHVWFGMFGLVCLVWYVWFGMFGLVCLVWHVVVVVVVVVHASESITRAVGLRVVTRKSAENDKIGLLPHPCMY